VRISAVAIALSMLLCEAVAFGAVARHPKTIRLVVVQTSAKRPTRTSFLGTDDVLIGGKKAGHDTLRCRATGAITGICEVVITLSDGTISAKFAVSAAPALSRKGKITGGTGAYAKASGLLRFTRANASGTRNRVVLTLK